MLLTSGSKVDALWPALRLDARQQRSEGNGGLVDERAEPLPGHHQALIRQQGDREPDRVAGRVEHLDQVGLTGQTIAWLQAPGVYLIAKPVSDLLVFGLSHAQPPFNRPPPTITKWLHTSYPYRPFETPNCLV